MLDTTKHTVLSGAKDKVAQEVSSYLSTETPPPAPLTVNYSTAQDLGRDGSYSGAILDCIQSYDEVQGIAVTIRGDNLIRDARTVSQDGGYEHKKAQADLIAYTGQFLSSCRAFETICQAEGKSPTAETEYVRKLAACMYRLAHSQSDKDEFQTNKQELIKLLNGKGSNKDLVKKMEADPNLLPSIERLNYELESALVRVGVKKKDVAKKMDAAKEFASLKDPHYHITSISRDSQTQAVIVESSIKAPSLSAETIKELEKIKRMAPILSSLPKRATDIPWFDSLSTFNKRLVINHIDEILMAGKGEKVLPTQLRKILPGLKNAYLEVRQVKQPGQALKTVLEGLRSASPSCLLKKGADKATEENIKVIQELAGKKEVCLNGLFTPWQPRGGNREASSLINKAIKSINKKGHAVTDALTPVDKKGRFTAKGKPTESFEAEAETAALRATSIPRDKHGKPLDSKQLKGAFTPANIGRVISKHGNTFSNMLKDAAEHLAALKPSVINQSNDKKAGVIGRNQYAHVVEYIKSGKGRSKDMNLLIDNFDFDDDTKRALKNLVECRRMEKQWIHWPDKQNTNYNRSARLAMVAEDFSESGVLRKQINAAYESEAAEHQRASSDVSKEATPGAHTPQAPYPNSRKDVMEEEHPIPDIISFCMSGKDRNGIRNYHAAVLAVSRELGDDGVNQSVATAVAGAGHQAYLAGVQGATACCFGAKKDSRGSMPVVYKKAGLQNQISRGTASANKFKTDKDKVYTYVFESEWVEQQATVNASKASWQDRTAAQEQGAKETQR